MAVVVATFVTVKVTVDETVLVAGCGVIVVPTSTVTVDTLVTVSFASLILSVLVVVDLIVVV